MALGTPVRSVRVAHGTFILYAPGVAAFVAGLLLQSSGLTLVGVAGLSVALILFIGNLVATLRAATVRDVTWWALTGATVFLAVTVAFGMALTGNLQWGFLGADRLTALGVHMHVAIAGWVGLVVIGVARHLLPMFLLSHVDGDR